MTMRSHLHSLLAALLLLLVACQIVGVSATPIAAPLAPGDLAHSSRASFPVPKSLPAALRSRSRKLFASLKSRMPRTVTLGELHLLLATSPTRTRAAIRDRIARLRLEREVERSHTRTHVHVRARERPPRSSLTEEERLTAKISRALDGLSSKRARLAAKAAAAAGKRGRMEHARARVQGLVEAAARARAGLSERARRAERWSMSRRERVRQGVERRMGKKVGRWTERRADYKLEVLPLGGTAVFKREKGWKGTGTRLIKKVKAGIRLARRNSVPQAVREDVDDGEDVEKMETDI